MLFKTIDKEEFKNLVDIHFRYVERIGPRKTGADARGRPIYQYLPIGNFEDMDLAYDTTEYSAKTYFIPFRETLSSYTFGKKDWKQTITYRKTPRLIAGLHSCDINALVRLDRIFAEDYFPNPYYLSRRENTFTIGISCAHPCDGGFCSSVGTGNVTQGFDLFLTDIGERYFVQIGSDKGFNAVKQIDSHDVSDKEKRLYLLKRNRFECEMKKKISVENLPNLLDIEFESSVWKKWGDKCLSCGSCAMVCPTCYCYGITEELSMDFKTGKKVKQLYSCNLYDFATVAGNHNFRPERSTRLKYRYYHQHRGFVKSFGFPLCVGCNRCGRACLAGINPVDVIRDLQMEYEL